MFEASVNLIVCGQVQQMFEPVVECQFTKIVCWRCFAD